MSGDKEAQELANERIRKSGGLFSKTEPLPEEAQPKERPPIEEEQGPGRARQPRTWDKKHPAFSFRILAEDNERLTEWAARLGMTRDEISRGLIGAALEALEDGRLTLEVDRQITVKKISYTTSDDKQITRRQKTTKSDVKWKWGK